MRDGEAGSPQAGARSVKALCGSVRYLDFILWAERSHCSMIRFSFRKDDESSRRIVAEG